MVVTCSVFGCKNRYYKGSNTTFHKYPLHNKELCEKWSHAVRKEKFTPTKNSRVCSVHFLATDYSINKQLHDAEVIPRLKYNAIPSAFVYSNSAKETEEKNNQIITLKRTNSEGVDFCITSTPKKSLLLVENIDRSKNLDSDSVLDCSESYNGANNSSSSSGSSSKIVSIHLLKGY